MPHETMKNSMRMRLILIPSGILLLGIVAAVAVALADAKARIASEIDSGVNLGGHLIGYALDDLAASKDPDAALQRLREGLAHVRHIEVAYRAQAPGTELEPAKPSLVDLMSDPLAAPRSAAPEWFLHLFEPARLEKIFPVSIGGQRRGELVMSGEPADEAAEIWRSLVFLTALLAAISAVIVGLLLLTARHTLKPIDELVD
jgi:two-component system sensor histidine kinase UhpB